MPVRRRAVCGRVSFAAVRGPAYLPPAVTPLGFILVTFAASLIAGAIGSLLGVGGGIIVVPVLSLVFGIDIRLAIGASLVSIIATSSGAAAAYVRERMTNLRVAMLLEVGTTAGALCGATLAAHISGRWLFVLFGLMLGYSALAMLRKRQEHADPASAPPDAWADKLQLHGSYFDRAVQREIPYRVTRAKLALAIMFVAGVASGLLGIGSGILKVPSMDLLMRLPIKVSTATSNFMIGVTGAAGAGIYFARGDINPFIAAPVACGVLIGATAGSKLLGRLHSRRIRVAFVVVLLWASAQMLWKGVRW